MLPAKKKDKKKGWYEYYWTIDLVKARSLIIDLKKEKTATCGIGILFVLLGIGTIILSIVQLANKSTPDTTWPGLIVSVISLSFMFFHE